MDKRIEDLLSNPLTIERIQSRLPVLFHIAELESSRAGKIGMEVGTVREKIIVAFFIYKFGAENVKTEIPTTEPEIDVEIFGKAVSIKTISGKRLNGVKLIWTVDRIKARYFFDKYQPHYDMVLIQVNWSNEGAFFYVPVEVQLEVFNSLGKERYLKLPVEGTNPRGVEISGESMRIISMHPDTLKVPIFWNKNYTLHKPYQRWLELWKKEE
jgi:hypothetical protein